jgi:hypothetical protein
MRFTQHLAGFSFKESNFVKIVADITWKKTFDELFYLRLVSLLDPARYRASNFTLETTTSLLPEVGTPNI